MMRMVPFAGDIHYLSRRIGIGRSRIDDRRRIGSRSRIIDRRRCGIHDRLRRGIDDRRRHADADGPTDVAGAGGGHGEQDGTACDQTV